MHNTEGSKKDQYQGEAWATIPAAIQTRRRKISQSWISRLRSGSVIELRHGGPPNLFLVHDGEGETLLYLNLARRLPDHFGVYGIEPRRVDRIPLAHDSLEDMAKYYIAGIRKKQPQGPYFLGGLCAGGVIAYEMACQLVSSGEKVELLALLEAAAPRAIERPGRIAKQRLNRFMETIKRHDKGRFEYLRCVLSTLVTISKKIVGACFWECKQLPIRLSVRARYLLLRALLSRDLKWPGFVPELGIHQIYESAHARYIAKQLLSGSAVLVRASSGEREDEPYRDIYLDDTFGWKGLIRDLRVIDVEGGHSSMLQERFVDSLADALLPFLQLHSNAL